MLPSVPEIVTWVELPAVTVRVEVVPATIEVGLAEIVTAAFSGKLLPLNKAHPASKTGKHKPAQLIHDVEEKRRMLRKCRNEFSSLSDVGVCPRRAFAET